MASLKLEISVSDAEYMVLVEAVVWLFVRLVVWFVLFVCLSGLGWVGWVGWVGWLSGCCLGPLCGGRAGR